MSNIYVIESGAGMCKVGVANDPPSRLSQLKTGHPHPLMIAHVFEVRPIKAYDIEKAAHANLAEKRMSGEWFDVSAQAAAQAVSEAIARIDPPKVDDDDRGRPLPDGDRDRLHGAMLALLDAQATLFDIVSHRHYSPNEVAGLTQLIRDVAEKIEEADDED